ncbi:J domain-containing protein [Chitinophagaceae bacterium MMS25-I14]
MPFRDHYKTLEIAPGASLQEIKKAYRRLAHQYHPDKNNDNHIAASYFRDIQEAYHTLADERRRALYDEERWLAGYSLKKKSEAVTPAWIYSQVLVLSNHMASVDTYRMNQGALRDYILLMLSDAHMAILRNAADAQTNHKIVTGILHATKGLTYVFFEPLMSSLSMLAGNDNELQAMLQNTLQARHTHYIWERSKPWIITAAALIICLLMYFFVRYTR